MSAFDDKQNELKKAIYNRALECSKALNLRGEGQKYYPLPDRKFELLLRDEKLQKIYSELEKLSDNQLTAVYNYAAALQATGIGSSPKPEKAPELYAKRLNRKETPPEFVKRVYGEYLDGNFVQPDLKVLDKKCYQAFRTWVYKNDKKVPEWLNFPTLKARNAKVLEASRNLPEFLQNPAKILKKSGSELDQERVRLYRIEAQKKHLKNFAR